LCCTVISLTAFFTKDAYLDKKRLLHKPSEQQRLLEEVPRVIPEMEDSKDTEVQVTTRDRSTRKSTVAFQGTNAESIVSLKRCSEEKYKGTNGTRASFLKSCAEEKIKGTGGERDLSLKSLSEEKSEATNTYTSGGTAVMDTQKQDTEGADGGVDGDTAGVNVQRRSTEATKANAAGDVPGTFVQVQGAKAADIITIDDDDDHPCERSGQTAIADLEAINDVRDTHDALHKTNDISHGGHGNVKVKGGASLHRRLWHYIDPQGDEQGPFSMEQLYNWWNKGFLPNDFRVWKTGQTGNMAISLIDALQAINEAVPNTGPHVVDD